MSCELVVSTEHRDGVDGIAYAVPGVQVQTLKSRRS